MFTDSNLHDICGAGSIIHPDSAVVAVMVTGNHWPVWLISTRPKYKTADGMAKVSQNFQIIIFQMSMKLNEAHEFPDANDN